MPPLGSVSRCWRKRSASATRCGRGSTGRRPHSRASTTPGDAAAELATGDQQHTRRSSSAAAANRRRCAWWPNTRTPAISSGGPNQLTPQVRGPARTLRRSKAGVPGRSSGRTCSRSTSGARLRPRRSIGSAPGRGRVQHVIFWPRRRVGPAQHRDARPGRAPTGARPRAEGDLVADAVSTSPGRLPAPAVLATLTCGLNLRRGPARISAAGPRSPVPGGRGCIGQPQRRRSPSLGRRFESERRSVLEPGHIRHRLRREPFRAGRERHALRRPARTGRPGVLDAARPGSPNAVTWEPGGVRIAAVVVAWRGRHGPCRPFAAPGGGAGNQHRADRGRGLAGDARRPRRRVGRGRVAVAKSPGRIATGPARSVSQHTPQEYRPRARMSA